MNAKLNITIRKSKLKRDAAIGDRVTYKESPYRIVGDGQWLWIPYWKLSLVIPEVPFTPAVKDFKNIEENIEWKPTKDDDTDQTAATIGAAWSVSALTSGPVITNSEPTTDLPKFDPTESSPPFNPFDHTPTVESTPVLENPDPPSIPDPTPSFDSSPSLNTDGPSVDSSGLS